MPAFIRVWDVEHGGCSMLWHSGSNRLAMIDAGHNSTENWRPSAYLRNTLNRTSLEYLFITNADNDHLSDLDGLRGQDIHVRTLFRNRSPAPETLRAMKLAGGPLSAGIERYLHLHQTYTHPVTEPFNDYMGGMQARVYCNTHPRFTDTNNLSLAVFIEYQGFKMLFAGDLERAGWLALLENDNFVQDLRGTTVLMASHHGRRSGYCEEIFDHFNPKAVVVSDKGITYSTQETVPDYRCITPDSGVFVRTTGRQRHDFRHRG